MKGTLKVKDDTVTIEEFSYPLEQFLIDEPDFKTPKADELVYQRGEGTLLYTGEDAKKDEKNYPSDLMEIFIARKKSYRGAFKARRNAAAQGRNWRDEIEEEAPKVEETDPDTENENENDNNTGDGDTSDQTGDQSQEEKGEGAADNQENESKNEADEKESKDGEAKDDADEKPTKTPDKGIAKPDTKDKKAKSTKQKDVKDGNNQAN